MFFFQNFISWQFLGLMEYLNSTKHLRELNGWCRDDGRYSCRTIMAEAQHGGCLRAGTHLSLCAVQGDVDYVWQTYMHASVCCRHARAGAQLLSRHPSTIKSQSLNSTAFSLTDNTVYCLTNWATYGTLKFGFGALLVTFWATSWTTGFHWATYKRQNRAIFDQCWAPWLK